MDAIKGMHTSSSKAALVYACSAATMNLCQTVLQPLDKNSEGIKSLMSRSFAAKQQATMDMLLGGEQAPSVENIMTRIYLEICLMTFNKTEQAFLILREAIAMIQMLGIDKGRRQESQNQWSPKELVRLQRLYWEIYIHERYQAVITMHPFILPPLRTGLPDYDSSIPSHVHYGFNRLIRLFLVMDNDFLYYWHEEDRQHPPRPGLLPLTVSWVEEKQSQLDDDEEAELATPAVAATASAEALTELQQADLIVTRAWMRTLVWQMAMSRCLLSSDAPPQFHEALSLAFPARRLAAQLRVLLARIPAPGQSIAMHGSGILRKMFEIINTVADVMTLVPYAVREDAKKPKATAKIEDFRYLVQVFMSLERMDLVLKEIIKGKIDDLKSIFPDVSFEGLVDGTHAG